MPVTIIRVSKYGISRAIFGNLINQVHFHVRLTDVEQGLKTKCQINVSNGPWAWLIYQIVREYTLNFEFSEFELSYSKVRRIWNERLKSLFVSIFCLETRQQIFESLKLIVDRIVRFTPIFWHWLYDFWFMTF